MTGCTSTGGRVPACCRQTPFRHLLLPFLMMGIFHLLFVLFCWALHVQAYTRFCWLDFIIVFIVFCSYIFCTSCGLYVAARSDGHFPPALRALLARRQLAE